MRARHLIRIFATRAFLGALAMISMAHADPPAPHYCEIAMDFSVNGHPVGASSTIVEFGQEAQITIGDEATHAWQFRIIADEPTIIHRANVIAVNVELYELINGESVLRARPHFAVAPGQRADLDTMFGEDDGRTAHVALVANPRSDADVEALTHDGDGGRK